MPGSANFHELVGAGLGLLLDALRGRAVGITRSRLSEAFEASGELLEFAVGGAAARRDLGLYTMLAAAAYHLGGFAARAYSLVGSAARFDALNPSSLERAVTRLIIRDIGSFRAELAGAIEATASLDAEAAAGILEGDLELDGVGDSGYDLDPVLEGLLKRYFHRALAAFDLGLVTGRAELVDAALEMLGIGLEVAESNHYVPIWWSYFVARQLISDLWSDSLHQQLPSAPTSGEGAGEWVDLRERFIAVLGCRERPVHELWPSQTEAVRRVLDAEDDLVVSLPTSAGKTRVAEVAALRTIAAGKRVVLVTPLRALSAQMEEDFEDLFGALGKSVSSLYGAAGVLYGDLDALRSADVVVTTPEKLDAALRVDAGMLDDVGLIVLDEGHMIGLDARGLRYETLIQRLLNRPDAAGRQLLCLSAVFPSGPAFDDFVSWIRSGSAGGPLQSGWRPTRQRFAQLVWNPAKKSARLVYDDNEQAWVDPILEGVPTGTRKNSKTFPSDQGGLTIAAAWRFAHAGSVLIYSTQPNFVETLAKCALKALKKRWIEPLDHDPAAFDQALAIGREWLGAEHVAVEALEHGFAVHHGGLPQPFRRAIETLLKHRKAPVAIASPTLAQGVNLAASTVLFHSISRAGQDIEAREFANVAGRAGRAFVDIEGLAVRPMFEVRRQSGKWKKLLANLNDRSLASGLAEAVGLLVALLAPSSPEDAAHYIEYLANTENAWSAGDASNLDVLLDHIDHALISLLDPLEADESEIPSLIDAALKNSLFQLSIDRLTADSAAQRKSILVGRAKYIWRRSTSQTRLRWRAGGLGFNSGISLDANLPTIGPHLLLAELAARTGDVVAFQTHLLPLAQTLLNLSPFSPDNLPDDWEKCLEDWVAGQPASLILKRYPNAASEIEGLFRYRLVWALDSARSIALQTDPDLYKPLAGATSLVVEGGVMNQRAARLVRWGLPSRTAAQIIAVTWTLQDPDRHGFLEWSRTSAGRALLEDPSWPTPETHAVVLQFVTRFLTQRVPTWSRSKVEAEAEWIGDKPTKGTLVRVVPSDSGPAQILSADFQPLGSVDSELHVPASGRLTASVTEEGSIYIDYIGPGFLGRRSTYEMFFEDLET